MEEKIFQKKGLALAAPSGRMQQFCWKEEREEQSNSAVGRKRRSRE